MKAGIISIGDELLRGATLNSNGSFMAATLAKLGIPTEEIVTISDDEEKIIASLRSYLERFDIILITGGLGPTPDDLTRSAVAKALSRKLLKSQTALDMIKARYQNEEFDSIKEEESYLPEGSIAMKNDQGDAPGIYINEKGKDIFLLPGPPSEMESVLETVIKIVSERTKTALNEKKILRTFLLKETEILKIFRNNQIVKSKDLKIAYLPKISLVDIVMQLPEKGDIEVFRKMANKAETVLADYIYTKDERSFVEVLRDLFIKADLKLASAESCSGGLFASKITSIAKASRFFKEGIVSYSNDSKVSRLDVSEDLLKTKGAVSSEVALSMAEGLRKDKEVDIAISSTGIAGPDKDQSLKEIGLVYIAFASDHESFVEKFLFRGDRNKIQEKTAIAMMVTVYKQALKLTKQV